MTIKLTIDQKFNIEGLLRLQTGFKNLNELVTAYEVMEKVAIPVEDRKKYIEHELPDGRLILKVKEMEEAGESEIELANTEARLLAKVLDDAVPTLTINDIRWIRPLRKQLESSL